MQSSLPSSPVQIQIQGLGNFAFASFVFPRGFFVSPRPSQELSPPEKEEGRSSKRRGKMVAWSTGLGMLGRVGWVGGGKGRGER